MSKLSVKIIVLLLLVFSGVALTQDAAIDWHSVDGGGGISADGASQIQLIGVIGQSDTVQMKGGNIQLSGGYLPLAADTDFLFIDSYE